MRRIGLRLIAASSVLLVAAHADATTRPHYGGTLRTEMRASVGSLDPREMPKDRIQAAAAMKIYALVYDRLVRLDERGGVVAALAVSWEHDAAFKRWQFRLRPNVKFHDGTTLTPQAVAEWWNAWHGPDQSASASGDSITIQAEKPMPGLMMELAEGPSFVFRVGGDGAVTGTGPFRVTEWQAGRRLTLTANEDHWGGRPFLDGITIEMGVTAAQQMTDFELGRADLVELEPAQVRRATQGSRKVWSSAPVELLTLVIEAKSTALKDVRVRQALGKAIDRAAIANVLLQRQGEPAGSLLPQWLSGYAFLFEADANVDEAREMVTKLTPAPGPVTLAYDGNDGLARTVAERVSLNARDAGLTVQPMATSAAGTPDLRLVRLRIGSVDAARALESLAKAMGEQATLPAGATDDPEELYAAERAVLESGRVIPLAYLSDTLGLGPQVRNWLPLRWGEWRLADVWLDEPVQGAAQSTPQNGPRQ
jgi:peptide/nickel transport system substrate-binding protein